MESYVNSVKGIFLNRDILGKNLDYRIVDDHAITPKKEAHQATLWSAE